MIAFNDGGTIVITPQGYYDYAGDTAEEYLNVRVGDEVSGISAYRERFYRPDLVVRALAGEPLPEGLPTLADVKPAPTVALVNAPTQIDSETLSLGLDITDRGGGIGDVPVHTSNGAAVSQTERGSPGAHAVAAAGAGRTIRLRLAPGSNEIRVIAFSADGSVHSNPASATVNARYSATRKPQMFALVVGIQDFENPRLALRYSIADATAVAEMLKAKAAPLFDKVNIELLTSRHDTSKNALSAAFLRYADLGAEDVFVFYVASHGTVEGDDLASREYFLIPSNVGSTTRLSASTRRNQPGGAETLDLEHSVDEKTTASRYVQCRSPGRCARTDHARPG